MVEVRSLMRRAAAQNADRIAILTPDQSLTYGEAWTRGKRLANAFAAAGAVPGDRIAVLEDNCAASSDFIVGTTVGNFVRVPLYRRNSAEAHAHMLRQTQVKVLVTAADTAEEIADIAADLPDLQTILVRDDNYESWLASFSDVDPDPPISPDDFYLIRHSAGTTGNSKGIAFSHQRWLAIERNWMFMLPSMSVGDCCTHVGPLSHGSGYLFLPIWLAGGCNILESKFDAARLLDLLEEHGGYTFGVPTLLSDLVASVEASGRATPDLSKLKAFFVSGAPVDRRTTLAAKGLFLGRVHQMYGQTECSPATWLGPEEWFSDIEGSDLLSSCGRPFPYTEVEIRGADNEPLPTGEAGEIAISSDGRMTCIWQDQELTDRRLIDGWVLTGDIGKFDANGFLYLQDRKDDAIISGGFNIWPAELENIIVDIPGVREVAVVGVPDARWGETPLALVVVDDLDAVTEEMVVELCRRRLGSYKKPGRVEISTTALRRTPLGKISRKLLREPYWSGEVRIGSA